MIILRGKRKGETARLHQYANDWISADAQDGSAIILNPTSVRLEPGEREQMETHTSTGFFWRRYEVRDDGQIVKRRRG